MKRSKMIRKLTRLLQTWEGSQLDNTTSREILDMLEKEGMLPPKVKVGKNGWYNDNVWEPEGKRGKKK
jgi:hypothetical protein